MSIESNRYAFDNVLTNVYVISSVVKDRLQGAADFQEKVIPVMNLVLGCIADDITGASDLGLMLASHGMPTTMILGVPGDDRAIPTPAVVIALKTRTMERNGAVEVSSAAARWLQNAGARQLYFKYCSTFDSTAEGNIGPVTDALMHLTGADLTVLLPAFPENGRTVRNGDLLVNGVPLADSPMRNHPLTPMRESSLIRLMDGQTTEGKTGSIDIGTVHKGVPAIRKALQQERAHGHRYVAIDTLETDDFGPIAEAVAELPLVTGASGIAAALPEVYRRKGLVDSGVKPTELPVLPGNAVVLAGSCSEATRSQIAVFENDATSIVVDPLSLFRGASDAEQLAQSAVEAVAARDVLVHSSTSPEGLKSVQGKLGASVSAELVEDTLAHVAKRLLESGVRKFIVAGGETSGAVAHALGIDELSVSRQIDPGVPWMVSGGDEPICLAFKSGNFGEPDLFSKALGMLP